MLPELRDILFLDIETVSAVEDFNSLDDRIQSLWSRKAANLRRDGDLTDSELYLDRAAIFAEFGKIICICVGKFVDGENGALTLRTKAYYSDDEHILLLEFKTMLERLSVSERLCAHNGKEFDFPYLSRRMLINGIPLPGLLDLAGKKPWEVPHYDTMDMWKFGDYKHFTSLDLLAAVFNIPSSKEGGIDGSQVNRVYYVDKNLEKIKDYCLRDVAVLAQLFLKLRGIPLEQELIVQVS
jgi:hypothetical protein